MEKRTFPFVGHVLRCIFGGGLRLSFPDVEALRAVSERPLKSRWKPVDLVCSVDGSEVTVRTKLGRGPQSTAVSIAEAVSHSLLAACGFRVAEGYFVTVSGEFAADLTAQYGFDGRVREGRHWGTRYMQRDVQEVQFLPEMVERLRRPADLFALFLADVVLGNPDRCRFGNVLLAHPPGSRTRFDIIPIDQSEAFFHPSAMLDERRLRSRFDRAGAEMLPGTERALLEGGREMVESAFVRVTACRNRVVAFVSEAAEEWFDYASVDSNLLAEFLEHRVDNLEELARKPHWLGLMDAAGGGYVLDLDM